VLGETHGMLGVQLCDGGGWLIWLCLIAAPVPAGPMVPTLNLGALNAMVKDAAEAAKEIPTSVRLEEDDDGLITARDIGLDLGVAALTARTVDGTDGLVGALMPVAVCACKVHCGPPQTYWPHSVPHMCASLSF
jgi:hypothetical protein